MNSEYTTVSGSSPLDILATFTDTILAVASTASFVQRAICGVSTKLSSRKSLSSSLVGGSFQNTSNAALAILFSATNNASLFTTGALANWSIVTRLKTAQGIRYVLLPRRHQPEEHLRH
jgi:hypothetical protein